MNRANGACTGGAEFGDGASAESGGISGVATLSGHMDSIVDEVGCVDAGAVFSTGVHVAPKVCACALLTEAQAELADGREGEAAGLSAMVCGAR